MGFYNYKNIDKTGATYRLIIGERSNGKTYGFLKKALQHKISENKASAYIRRFDTEIKASKIKLLFNGLENTGEFKKIVKDKFDDIYYFGGVFYLRKLDGDKVIEKTPLLYLYALNTWERYKGQDIGEIYAVCFDEFCTRGKYLIDEFIALQQTLSSIIRNRRGVIIYMIANTVNKYCPHFTEFGIDDIDKIEQGTIANFQNGIAIEYCKSSGRGSKTEYLKPFKNAQLAMLKNGAWEVAQYPHLPKSARNDNVEDKFFIFFNSKIICGELRSTPNGGLYIFFHPQTKTININQDLIIYSTEPSTNYLHSTNIIKYQPTKEHKIISELIRGNKLFYDNNNTGEIIRNWLLWQGVK